MGVTPSFPLLVVPNASSWLAVGTIRTAERIFRPHGKKTTRHPASEESRKFSESRN